MRPPSTCAGNGSNSDVELTPIGVTGPADRQLVAGLREIEPVLAELRPAVLLIGGLMARLWLHAVPLDMPARPTSDIDLGIDKRALRLSGDRRVVGPLLESRGFEPGSFGEEFRYSKEVPGLEDPILVDVVMPPGESREDPPVLEPGLTTVAAPGLAYAVKRGAVVATGRFVDGQSIFAFDLPIPVLDAAFVLKAALVASGVRRRPDRVRSDSVDAVMLAAACLRRPSAIDALREQSGRTDVRKSLNWLRESFRSRDAIGSRRIEAHFEREGYGLGAGEWAHHVAVELSGRVHAPPQAPEPRPGAQT